MCLTCLTSVQIFPTSVRNLSPTIHSALLSLVSRANLCRCVTSRSSTYFRRGFSHCELMAITFSVMLSTVRSFRIGVLVSEGSILNLVSCICVWIEGG